LILTVLSGVPPWISLGLAFTFGFYGLLKKKLSLSALESLGAETLAAAPVGLLLLCFSFTGADQSLAFSGFQGLTYLHGLPYHTWILLALCGGATMLPLYCFARGAKLLPLSTVGFTQFVAPTLQFSLGLFVFGEAFSAIYLIAFLFIWTAVILYVTSLLRK
jgi:chloramphenicol-sensitive protein RarD